MTFFSRQTRIPGWNQPLLASQTALLLGVGGLGSNVSVALCRLGLKKIFLVDMDVVDIHNLNRQMIFGKKDVNKSKVESSHQNLEQFHNLCTEIVPLEVNALTGWQKIVEAAKQSDVIFNMIDVGTYFDVAVQALALKVGAAFVFGGTFAETFTVDFYPDRKEGEEKIGPCMVCTSDVEDKGALAKLRPETILELPDLDWIPKDKNPPSQTNFYLCSMASDVMVMSFVNWLFGKDVPTRSIWWTSTFEVVKWEMEREPKCGLCGPPSETSPE
eukprot:CAMPEP_0201485694 /NCGR_PEP_ID=MMETSP0151_2-20130828/9794_1 /ASSEMBLY_ACC=CAM_ASM_000257 /TAXON_ID=200890 /ORGANISM="Paramoeba atlantica, Strain 621/1 / CCAP 1560/9" /LENGTH=271 /DNA_ID=CAMNT_0047869939 /DNA_START=136 /DNA_END=951 /DNA_ORIENTATION=+